MRVLSDEAWRKRLGHKGWRGVRMTQPSPYSDAPAAPPAAAPDRDVMANRLRHAVYGPATMPMSALTGDDLGAWLRAADVRQPGAVDREGLARIARGAICRLLRKRRGEAPGATLLPLEECGELVREEYLTIVDAILAYLPAPADECRGALSELRLHAQNLLDYPETNAVRRRVVDAIVEADAVLAGEGRAG